MPRRPPLTPRAQVRICARWILRLLAFYAVLGACLLYLGLLCHCITHSPC